MKLRKVLGFAFIGVTLASVASCHSRSATPTKMATPGGAQAPASGLAEPLQAIPSPGDGVVREDCPQRPLLTASVSGETGRPQATVAYPDHWHLSRSKAGTIDLWVDREPLKVIVSAWSGGPTSDAEIRKMHDDVVGPKCKAISPWEHLAGAKDHGAVGITCSAPTETMVVRYHFGANGLVMATLELGGRVDPCVRRDADRMVQELQVEFAKVSNQAAAIGAPSPCPPSVESGASGGGACLEPAVLGRQQVELCSKYLEKKGWTIDLEVQNAISQKTGKSIVCYQKP